MGKCCYIMDNEMRCNKKTSEDDLLCLKHRDDQKGGGLMSLVYPLGSAVGAMTFSLIRINNMFGDYVLNKKNKTKE